MNEVTRHTIFFLTEMCGLSWLSSETDAYNEYLKY